VIPTAEKSKQQLLIAGNGMAAGRLIDEIMKRSPDKFDITVVGDELQGSYNRIMLSPVLAGELKHSDIIQKDSKWYAANNIRFYGGARVTSIQPENQSVKLENGKQIGYDHLVIATGSSPSKIPAKNQHLAHIFPFRTLDDVHTIDQVSQNAKSAIVVGGGLLGLEAAYGLAQKDIKVTLIHRSDWLLNRQLDKNAGDLLRKVMHNLHIDFRLGDEITQFNGRDTVCSASLKSGETLPCDLVVIATGISPNAALATESGIETKRAILVDDFLNTSSANISALGECCEHDGNTFGLVEPIWQQCTTLADRLTSDRLTPFSTKPVATKLKVSGVQLYSAGEFITRAHHHEIIMQDPANNMYRKLLLENDRIVGIVLFGDTRDGNEYFELMQNQIPVSKYLPQLIFGQHYCKIDKTTIPSQSQVA